MTPSRERFKVICANNKCSVPVKALRSLTGCSLFGFLPCRILSALCMQPVQGVVGWPANREGIQGVMARLLLSADDHKVSWVFARKVRKNVDQDCCLKRLKRQKAKTDVG